MKTSPSMKSCLISDWNITSIQHPNPSIYRPSLHKRDSYHHHRINGSEKAIAVQTTPIIAKNSWRSMTVLLSKSHQLLINNSSLLIAPIQQRYSQAVWLSSYKIYKTYPLGSSSKPWDGILLSTSSQSQAPKQGPNNTISCCLILDLFK